MNDISQKIVGGIVALILGSAFLPLLSYWDLIAVTNPTIQSLLSLIPIMGIVGLGLFLWNKRK